MATANEIFALTGAEEPHIVIGSDRVITVPDELRRIAVQFDNNIETVTFDCPRYWDEHDMSTMTVYVNYMRPDGKPGSYKADNVHVDDTDDNIIHFDWTISRNVSEVNGNLSILVCIRKVDDEGNEQNHWNSELNKDMYISEGLNCSEDIIDSYPDVITQILTNLDNIYDYALDKSKILNRVFVGEEYAEDEVYNANAINASYNMLVDRLDVVNERLDTLEGDYTEAIKLIGGAE